MSSSSPVDPDAHAMASTGNQQLHEEEEEEEEEGLLTELEITAKGVSEGHDDDTIHGIQSRVQETHVRYSFPRVEKKGELLGVPDLVWGKVKGYPWWPGQILDPSYASSMALRHRKKDRLLLVAYFADKTFAWCSPSQLKPFLPFFGQMEKQSSSDAFSQAVRGAVAEASRRVEMGMICPCVPEELYSHVKCHCAENAGIQKGVAISTMDSSLGPSLFKPEGFLEYVRALALCPKGGFASLDLAFAQAHLMAYQRSKGCASLCAFSESQGLVESDGVTADDPGDLGECSNLPARDEEKLSDFISRKLGRRTWISSCHKRKDGKKDGRNHKSLSKMSEDGKNSPLEKASEEVYGRKHKKTAKTPFNIGGSKKSLSKMSGDDKNSSMEQASEEVYGKKRKKTAKSPFTISGRKKRMLELLGDSVKKSPSPVPYQSFKVGEFIRRFASKLTNSSPILKTNGGSTLPESGVENEPFVGRHGSEREGSPSTSSSSDEVKTSDKTKHKHGKAKASSCKEIEPPGEIKYSRRKKTR